MLVVLVRGRAQNQYQTLVSSVLQSYRRTYMHAQSRTGACLYSLRLHYPFPLKTETKGLGRGFETWNERLVAIVENIYG